MEGWIKLHRKILDSKYGCNLELRGLFDSLLLMANHKEGFTADGTRLTQGQFMTSQLELSKKFNVTRDKMRRLLLKLEDAKQIAQQTSSKNTIITIINWDGYQVDEHQAHNGRTSNAHQAHTNKNAKNNKNGKNISNAPLFSVEEPQLEEEVSLSDLERNALTALNSICGKAFRPTQGNMKHIRARIKEGYKYEEFVKVIQFKLEQWGNDTKMRGYLRPETIFGTKFDSYLAEASDERLKAISDDDLIRQYFPGFTA